MDIHLWRAWKASEFGGWEVEAQGPGELSDMPLVGSLALVGMASQRRVRFAESLLGS
jgi:hypothetical protein